MYVSSKRKYDTFIYYLEFRRTFVTKSPNLVIVGERERGGARRLVQFNLTTKTAGCLEKAT